MPTARHLQHLEGGNALSAFRAQALLARLRERVPRIAAVHGSPMVSSACSLAWPAPSSGWSLIAQ
jgi:hypothetical protein